MLVVSPLTLDHIEPWSALLAVCFDRQPLETASLLTHFYGQRQLVAWGIWDGPRLAAQYSCLLVHLALPEQLALQTVGMSMNMAVHPDFRGQGLIKRVAEPAYAEVVERGGVAGVGFSNAAGVRVDRHSKGYGYQVVGKMVSWLVVLPQRPLLPPLSLTHQWPDQLLTSAKARSHIHFAHTPASLRQRFARHPFRTYAYGVNQTAAGPADGVVVYRPLPWRGVSLLASYGEDEALLNGRWLSALWSTGVRFVHLLGSPQNHLLPILRRYGWCFSIPYSRSPYYLTAKPLGPATPPALFTFNHWDCLGGDIL